MLLWHALWQQSLGWAGPPVRLGAFALLILLAVTRAGPWALRRLGRLVQERSAAVLLLLTYPEFVLTSRARRRGKTPPQQHFDYGLYLGVAERRLYQLGSWMSRLGQFAPALRLRLFFVVMVAVTAFWYVGSDLSKTSGGGDLPVQGQLARFDAWLLTGQWVPGLPRANQCSYRSGRPAQTAHPWRPGS